MKHHLARTHHNAKPCEKVPEDVINMFLKILEELKQRNCIEQDDVDCFDEMENVISTRGSMVQYVSKTKAKQVTLPSMLKDRTKPCVDICRMIYAEALAFSLVKSSWFHTAIQSIREYGKGLKPPSYHEVRVTFLKKEVDNVHSTLEKYKSEWKKTGPDGWQDGCGHSITNFLINSPKETVFLKSLDTSLIIKNGVPLFELLDTFVEEIGLCWESYGGSCKELQELAIRVLSLTCSATGCERNWSTFQRIHSKKRNRLEAQRLNALVFVKYNLTLELRQKKREENGDAYDPICLSIWNPMMNGLPKEKTHAYR
ncbi:hypothetical protein RHSIM_Rhsim03G0072400 [Rhododendron simsii]|uniref:DUF659 domain-containing protein n=1 Tax=Rhododendron simsii TaxID=118357 RepID=A0A834HE63_RHOSS|nr:hypothetical protein RHSIM_Rhsim03G0072400 [Rhododendron simsii]